jgi:hypothetical protein
MVPDLGSGHHAFYYCSSVNRHDTKLLSFTVPYVVKPCGVDVCSQEEMWNCAYYHDEAPKSYQSYGQYAKLFYDVHGDTDGDKNLVGDSDDEDMGK